MPLSSAHPLIDGRTGESALIRAYRGQRQPTPPVWFAGTVAGDAALFASEILAPVQLAGADLENPIRTASDVARLRPIDPASLDPIRESIAQIVAQLGVTPLIGAAAAPFTLAALLVEGGSSTDQLRARTMMYADPQSWATLLNWCADVAGEFLLAQVEAGASAVQLVDPSIGSLSEQQYVRRVAPHSKRVLSHLRGFDVPKLHVGVDGNEVLVAMHGIGADAMGVDWRIPLDEASRRLGSAVPLQGNLDPALLGAPWKVLEAHVLDVIDRGRAAPAHVLTLGDSATADPEVLTRLVEFVHSL